jgi:Cu(I)/Ag(I) efflux system protein CusF
MKIQNLLFTAALLSACSSPSNNANSAASATTAASAPPAATTVVAPVASATGVVKAIDPAAKTITLDHGPVAALQWPAMTMTFNTGDLDLGPIKPGDQVAFEFTVKGMDATLSKLDRQ